MFCVSGFHDTMGFNYTAFQVGFPGLISNLMSLGPFLK